MPPSDPAASPPSAPPRPLNLRGCPAPPDPRAWARAASMPSALSSGLCSNAARSRGSPRPPPSPDPPPEGAPSLPVSVPAMCLWGPSRYARVHGPLSALGRKLLEDGGPVWSRHGSPRPRQQRCGPRRAGGRQRGRRRESLPRARCKSQDAIFASSKWQSVSVIMPSFGEGDKWPPSRPTGGQ